MIFTYDYKPAVEDFTHSRTLSLKAILKMLENAANGHSALAGDTIFETERIKTAWVLTDWQIQIDDFPTYKDTLKAETWSEKLSSPLVANRNFLLYKNGEIFGRGATRWVLFDIEAGRLCKIDASLIEKYKSETKTVFDDKKLIKIDMPETFAAETKITVRRSDIDFNNHVHNLVYIDYALEALPPDVYSQNFKNLRITYKTAITDSKEILCKYGCKDGKHTVAVYDENGTLCTMLMMWD